MQDDQRIYVTGLIKMTRTIEEELHALMHSLLGEAQSEAEKLKDKAAKRVEELLRQAQQQVMDEHRVAIADARQKAETRRSQLFAAANQQAQMLWLKKREEILNRVFDCVQKKLPTLVEWSDYPNILRQLVEEAASHLDDKEIRLRADPRSAEHLMDGILDELGRRLKLTLSVGESLPRGTGILAETIDGHQQFDNTLEARLNRMKESLRAPVYQILTGETP